ncbi:MAG: hypothetical protein AAF591_11275 [Verrucomicrobiota bacterium]
MSVAGAHGESESRVFHDAAGRVVSRLTVCRWVDGLRKSAVVSGLIGMGGLAILRAGGWGEYGIEFAVGLTALWVAGAAVYALSGRPHYFRAMALWDERAGRKEAFASALFFEGKAADELTAGERLHLATSEESLAGALAGMRDDLPVPRMRWQWFFPIVVLALAMSPIMKPGLAPGDVTLSEAMQDRAREEAKDLEMDERIFERMASLKEGEKEEIKKLKQDIGSTAEGLKDSAEKTAREVLRELEARAREAEKLAERMGDRGEEWASEEMLREMSQHVDTAELAGAIKDKKAAAAASESETIAKSLGVKRLRDEARERMTTALSRTMTEATDEDHKRPVGRHVGEAAVDMRGERAEEAAREFEELAAHFKRLDERERAKEKLKEMADKLRESGANIAGEGTGAMKKLANNQGQAGDSGAAPQMQSAPLPNMTPMTGQEKGQRSQGAGQATSMPSPGLKPGEGQGKGQQGMARAGQSGEAKSGGQLGFIPGGSGGTDRPAIFAPIPGMAMSGGGPQAGHGTAPMEGAETKAMKSTQSGLVDAQVNRDGESSVRAIEGGQRREEADRETAEQIVEFLQVEEEALDGQPLPASRREHILRYFTALRERFEESEGE